MRGEIKIKRCEFDDTVVPGGRRYTGPHGESLEVIRETRVRHQSWFTRFLRRVTFGLWPFGRHAYIPAVREDRGKKRAW